MRRAFSLFKERKIRLLENLVRFMWRGIGLYKRHNFGIGNKFSTSEIEKLKSFDLSSIKKFSNDSEVVEAQSKLKKPTLCRRFRLLAVIKQCYYYIAKDKYCSDDDKKILNTIDKIYTAHPYYGYRRMLRALRKFGFKIEEKKVRTMMAFIDLKAIYPEPIC